MTRPSRPALDEVWSDAEKFLDTATDTVLRAVGVPGHVAVAGRRQP
jgi:hypothetical protein